MQVRREINLKKQIREVFSHEKDEVLEHLCFFYHKDPLFKWFLTNESKRKKMIKSFFKQFWNNRTQNSVQFLFGDYGNNYLL